METKDEFLTDDEPDRSNYFTMYGADYYRKTLRVKKLADKMWGLKAKVIEYTGQNTSEELDAIIESGFYYAEALQKTTEAELKCYESKWEFIDMYDTLGIPCNTKITVTIPHQVVFEIWVDEEKEVHIEKIADLDPEVNDDIIILSGKPPGGWDEDEEAGKKLLVYVKRSTVDENFLTRYKDFIVDKE